MNAYIFKHDFTSELHTLLMILIGRRIDDRIIVPVGEWILFDGECSCVGGNRFAVGNVQTVDLVADSVNDGRSLVANTV